jgi:hypothetical protein
MHPMAAYDINPAIAGELGSKTRQQLDGVEYRLQLFWLAAAPRIPFYAEDDPPPDLVIGEPGAWTMTLSQQDGTALIAGQILRHGINLLAGFKGDTRFPGSGLGQLLAWDYTGAGQDPGRNDLDPGTNIRLVYRDRAEVTG